MIYSFCKSKYSANLKRFTLVLFIFLFTIIGSNCQAIYETGFVPIPDQPISDEVEIGSEWVELTPPKPLIPYGKSQSVEIGFLDYDITKSSRNHSILHLADGRQTRIEAFLYDDQGNSYPLQIGARGGGVNFFPRGEKKSADDPDFYLGEYSFTSFPTDRTYTKLRMRSEISLKCKYVHWEGSNPK
jgi:hypothetical protein